MADIKCIFTDIVLYHTLYQPTSGCEAKTLHCIVSLSTYLWLRGENHFSELLKGATACFLIGDVANPNILPTACDQVSPLSYV